MSKTKEIANEMKAHFADFEDNHDKNMNALNEVQCRGAKTILISSSVDGDLKVDNNNTFSGILANIYFQLLSYKIALKKNNNPDYPRNLAKVVTVE